MNIEHYFSNFTASGNMDKARLMVGFQKSVAKKFVGLELAGAMSFAKLNKMQASLCFARYTECLKSRINLISQIKEKMNKAVGKGYDAYIAEMMTDELIRPRVCKKCQGTGSNIGKVINKIDDCRSCEGTGVKRWGGRVAEEYGVPSKTFYRTYKEHYDILFSQLNDEEVRSLNQLYQSLK